MAVFFAAISLSGPADAQSAAKTFIDYFQPTPITCSPLSSATWGVAAVLPRDTCNGIESAKGAGVAPAYYYWDGSIIRAADGTYHLFADRWPGSAGFNPGWESSDPIHAVSSGGPLGPFTDKGYVYSDASFGSDSHHGHNSMACTLLDGTYCFVVSEVVPFTIFTASSLDGPWTPCAGNPGAGLSVPAGFGGNTSYGSNVSLVVRPDGNFEIIQRHGLIALSTTGICGPYKAQQPTNTYPSSEAIPSASAASIYPNRTKHTSADSYAPSSVESTYTLAEDPVIWYSGGQYHVLYDYPDDRVGYHLTSVDGVHDWTDAGLAYDPRMASKLFSYVESTTVNQWYKMERPGVLLEDGHITHVTFAVSDVDKNNQISAGSNHGSKVIVVPFDGATFDAETGVGGAGGGTGGHSGTGGAGGLDGGAGMGGASARGGTRIDAGAAGAGGGAASGAGSAASGTSGSGGMRIDAGSAAVGGSAATGGSSAAGGTTLSSGTGGAITADGSGGRGGSATTGGSGPAAGSSGSGGMVTGTGGAQTVTNGSASAAGAGGNGVPRGGATSQGGATSANGSGKGCACALGDGRGVGSSYGFGSAATLLGLLALAVRIRCRCFSCAVPAALGNLVMSKWTSRRRSWPQNEEPQQDAEGCRRHGEEVNGRK